MAILKRGYELVVGRTYGLFLQTKFERVGTKSGERKVKNFMEGSSASASNEKEEGSGGGEAETASHEEKTRRLSGTKGGMREGQRAGG